MRKSHTKLMRVTTVTLALILLLAPERLLAADTLHGGQGLEPDEWLLSENGTIDTPLVSCPPGFVT